MIAQLTLDVPSCVPSPGFRHRLASVCLAALAVATAALAAAPSLEEDFLNPPVKMRPYVWWHWMGSNFSKEGITKDLEAMKESGIGGATIFNLSSAVQESHKPTQNNPWPDQTYRSPKYWEALRHAAAEAQRLGLEVGLHNSVGYSTTGGPWIDEEKNMQQVVAKSLVVEGGKRVTIEIPRPDPVRYKGWGANGQTSKFFRDIAVLAVPESGTIDPAKIIDLTAACKDGRLVWDAPAGKWQVTRLAHAPTGARPHPVPDDVIGKTHEVDKLSLELNQYHWDQVIEPMKKHLGPFLGKSFGHFLIDSYEAGPQDWSADFRGEFRKRKGYDPVPWLLTLKKRVIGSQEMSERFAWDLADVVSTLYYENGWLTGFKKTKAVGMDLQFEPYGGRFDTVEGAALADIPMGEFWTAGGGGINGTVVAAARAAGRTVVGAEAFTGPPTLSKWSETPAFLKRSADGAFASGANRLVLHHWVHQPFDDRYKPGMGMGWWGTHFGRHQTWAKDGVAFYQYLGRTQAMLQSGEAPADFVSVGKAQGSDVISWRAFRAGLGVRDGRIVLASGRTYPFLSIPHGGLMQAEDVESVARLLKQGAVIVSSKPTGAPGLAGYPESDRSVVESAGKLWGGQPVCNVGKGKLYTSGDVQAAIRDLGIKPLVQIRGAAGIGHSARQRGEATLVFLANSTAQPANFTASFRISGKRPELWDAEDGSIRMAPVWREIGGRTEVDLGLGGYKSLFVVFRDSPLPADHVVAVEARGSKALRVIKARFGSPDGARWMDVTDKIAELAAQGAVDIKSVNPGVFGKDPAPNKVKQLELDYELGGKAEKLTVAENQPLSLGTQASAAGVQWVAAADGSLTGSAPSALEVECVFASGKRKPLALPEPAAPITLNGLWQVTLDSPVDTKHELTLTSLLDLAGHDEPAVKYFSGTATYRTTFQAPATTRAVLNLGQVHNLVRVTLNGKDLGVVWRAPFVVDVSRALKPGGNELELAVTNTWHNRLVGDEQFPADFEWGEDRGEKGHALLGYPDWFVKNQPRPQAGRKCFVVWYYHRKDTALLPAGLLGPVVLAPWSELPVAANETK